MYAAWIQFINFKFAQTQQQIYVWRNLIRLCLAKNCEKSLIKKIKVQSMGSMIFFHRWKNNFFFPMFDRMEKFDRWKINVIYFSKLAIVSCKLIDNIELIQYLLLIDFFNINSSVNLTPDRQRKLKILLNFSRKL